MPTDEKIVPVKHISKNTQTEANPLHFIMTSLQSIAYYDDFITIYCTL